MENKYYTPDISEFYVGFEYEYFGDRVPNPDRWYKDTIDKRFIVPQITRVKYLDKEAIESFDWKIVEDFYDKDRRLTVWTYQKDSSIYFNKK